MSCQRSKILIQGAVQGVGFRPFVYRLATEMGLAGFVANSNSGVHIEVEGEGDLLQRFENRLRHETPPRASITKIECSQLAPRRLAGFKIARSQDSGSKSATILPDIATCDECLREIFDPANRRHLYPFTNCTHCGPRFSIIEALPYDRKNTSMRAFAMCAQCEEEYHDANGRRFHAQPNACPACGPRMQLWDPAGSVISESYAAISHAAEAVRAGLIVAIKGIGGFQLLADARNAKAIQTLRLRKQRREKPFAVMFPSIESVEACCAVSEIERSLLLSPAAPIVLLSRDGEGVVDLVAPYNPTLGVMLPSAPPHHLIMRELEFPVVATSGNHTDEPICIDEDEALKRLDGIADLFLVHNRQIVRHMDDSVVQTVLGREMILRRARGYAPLPVCIPEVSEPILAVGGHLKNTVALGFGKDAYLSQHIGNLETEEAFSALRRASTDLPKLYGRTPAAIACDLHPDYFSTWFARESGMPAIPTQHHHAHILSCMAENRIEPPALGVAWDGTGYGTDGTIWGGEFLRITDAGFERVAHLRQFPLPGGDACTKDGRRAALGILREIFGEDIFNEADASQPGPSPRRNGIALLDSFSAAELRMIRRMLAKQLNSPVTSSAGRLFDAVAALMGLRTVSTFEGQAAMSLEFAVAPEVKESYAFHLRDQGPWVVDWEPAILAMLEDIVHGEKSGIIAAKFHNGLADAIADLARKIGESQVVLSGGCFQNRSLLERTVRRLEAQDRQVCWHQKIPPNDGGLALGQILAARLQLLKQSTRTRIPATTNATQPK